MSEKKGGRSRGHQYGKKINIDDTSKESSANIDENSPVIKQFKIYADELDKKNDRFVRIVTMGREVTIESKKIIFLLHTIHKKNMRQSILETAKLRLNSVKNGPLCNIALELENQDPYQYLKAYQNGLEEYIEAVTFYQYLESGTIQNWDDLKKTLIYVVGNNIDADNETTPNETRTINTLITPYEYIYGIADLTGELMRKSINNLGVDLSSCYQICRFLKNTYKGFLGCTMIANKKMNRKLYTLRQNLQKTEQVCYTIEVMGLEAAALRIANANVINDKENVEDRYGPDYTDTEYND